MAVALKSLYDTDFLEWTAQVAELLRAGRFDEIDIENLATETEDLGKSQQSAVISQLSRMMAHLIKQKIQPERDGASWQTSIASAQMEIEVQLRISPSLRRFLQRELAPIYKIAVKQAVREMQLPRTRLSEIPAECPYTIDELIDGDPQPWQ
jgi:hypothetical protein